ncbi:DUF4236 domain-containing protein [Clostridium sp. DSM 100503]|uniref:DUF4236 domain-containing protein n=1 Tax=Clostridium sp. DSM 100503 TaxID=2963282 RepID=UPI00214A8178|nr:DUF4236 domain-containing protein [Clostridium sp. DSM 100503]MCR1952686.1 DUF4236 domain-containing protein [Clostridium sp. DSM 100503]
MGWSFRKSFKLGEFLKLNLSSKSGIGLSTGVKGARISFNKNGINFNGGKGIFRIRKYLSFKKIFRIFK